MVTRYQRDNEKPQTEGYATQWPHDTKGVIRSRKPKDMQHNGHKIPKEYSEASTEGYTTQWPQDTKGVFRNRKSKDIQHNGHKIPKG